MIDFYVGAGMDVIAVVDPLVSQVSPRHFKRFLSSTLHHRVRHDPISGWLFLVFCVWGCDKEHIEGMCQTNP
jgi:uroporphyrinogen decarboxylase